MSATTISDDALDDLRCIEADHRYAVKFGHALLSNNLARWQQTGSIGWFLTDKGCAALAAATGAVDTKTALENGDSR